MSQSIGMISLGCAKNQVNAEQMLFLLRVAGYEILPDPDGADLVIINTCGFIEDAKAEAIDNILAMGEMKKEGRIGKILVTGCSGTALSDGDCAGNAGGGRRAWNRVLLRHRFSGRKGACR